MQVQIIYWRDIPTQVRGKKGRKRSSLMLPDRFQKTVNRAAFRAKAINGEAYMEGFRNGPWTAATDEGLGMDGVLQAKAAEIDTEFTDQQLNSLALNKGLQEEQLEN